MSGSAGAQIILDSSRKRLPWMGHLFADGAHDRTWLMDKAAFVDFVIKITRSTSTPDTLPAWLYNLSIGERFAPNVDLASCGPRRICHTAGQKRRASNSSTRGYSWTALGRSGLWTRTLVTVAPDRDEHKVT